MEKKTRVNSEVDTKAEEIFADALALDVSERAAFLDAACSGDSDLRAKVQEMLRDSALADSFFGENPAFHSSTFAGKESDVIGPYTLRQKLGEGGFGEVWMAEQSRPISRKVALKIIKAGMDTREFLARFESERQALAMMEHPNIAKVLDAGATAAGRPYFAMELVRGIPITRYCDEAGLGTDARLALFSDVCSAIGHAHQKGVIHRDIKPSNVLVTLHGDRPVVKVIDFGIAKAVEGKLTDLTLFTRFEQFLGTPAYMSPEQASLSGLDIDTRADIYGLGVLLYELLVGKPPFESRTLVEAGYDEMRRIIREVEPSRPSARLKTTTTEERIQIAQARKIPPDKVSRMVEPDLDWIVLKAIEKDRTRRYATADELARDVDRFLAHEPVMATPPSAAYLFGKFARRHRFALRAATIIALLMVFATAVSSWLALRATKAEQLASEKLAEASAERDAKELALKESEAQTARAIEAEKLASERLAEVTAERDAKDEAIKDAELVSKFLSQVFRSPEPYRDGRTVTVLESLDAAVKKVQSDISGQPQRKAKLLEVLALTYDQLGIYDKAEALQQEVLDIRKKILGDEHLDTLSAMSALARYHDGQGHYEQAIAARESEFELRRKRTDAEGIDSEHGVWLTRYLAEGYAKVGRFEKAVTMWERSFSIRLKLSGEENPETMRALSDLRNFYFPLGKKYDRTRRELTEKLWILQKKLLGEQSSESLWTQSLLLEMDGRNVEAKSVRQKFHAARAVELEAEVKTKAPGRDLHALLNVCNLGNAYALAGRKEEAWAWGEKAVELYLSAFGPKSPHVLLPMRALAENYLTTGRSADALQSMQSTVELAREIFGADAENTISLMRRYADIDFQITRRPEKGLELHEEIVELRRKKFGSDNPKTLEAVKDLEQWDARARQAGLRSNPPNVSSGND